MNNGQDKVAEALVKKAKPMSIRTTVADRDRMTIVAQVHHESRDGGPHTLDIRTNRFLTTADADHDSRAYRKIGQTPTPLDLSRVEFPGYVVIENTTGIGRRVQPTPEEREADEASIIELSRIGSPEGTPPIAWVRVGMPYMGELYDPASVCLTSLSGEASAVVTIYPE